MDIETVKLRSMEELIAYDGLSGGKRRAVEALIAKEHRFHLMWRDFGYCEACGSETVFLSDWRSSDRKMPNFRERMVCKKCGLNNRQRFVAGLVAGAVRAKAGGGLDAYFYEQVTKFYKSMKKNVPGLNLTGSEYMGPDIESGKTVRGIRHEDAMNLSLGDGVMDLIVSNDVYEHIPDADRAFAEAARVLRPGGKLIFSVPFYGDRPNSGLRAKITGGRIEYLLPRQFHGNPVSLQRSLVYNDFGWDILRRCRAAGFNDAYALVYYSFFYGYIGGGMQMVFIAEK